MIEAQLELQSTLQAQEGENNKLKSLLSSEKRELSKVRADLEQYDRKLQAAMGENTRLQAEITELGRLNGEDREKNEEAIEKLKAENGLLSAKTVDLDKKERTI